MPNTTNYSFPTPADTDLVKNGADAIRDLGDAVDTAMNTALGTKKSGLVLLNTTSFSGVASQSVTSVFSSTYDNYAIKINLEPITTTAQNVLLRLRTASDDSGANYYQSGFFNSSGGAAYTGEANSGQTSFATVYQTTVAGDYAMANIELFAANLAKPTLFQNIAVRKDSSSSSQLYRVGALNTTTQYTGFTIFVTTTMTGTVSVYGYSK